MYFITKSGRVISDMAHVGEEEFLTRDTYPVPPPISGKIGFVVGISRENDEILYEYSEEENVLESTDLELIMQAQADAELRDFAIQQGQELLAQQMADIELAVLGGAV